MRAFFTTLLLFAYYVEYGQHALTGQEGNDPDHLVDTRIDNMRYWLQQAERGLVPFNPSIKPEPALFRGDRIAARGVKTANSPDIPVTTVSSVSESENSVFIDPANSNHLLNSNNSTSWNGSSAGTVFGAGYFVSQNAGIGWAGSTAGTGGTNNGDPATAIGLNGRQYINYCSAPGGQWIAMSDDGTNWSTATITGNPGDVADKNHLWIDNAMTSPFEGNLYAGWTDLGGADDTHIMLSRSSNDGLTWSTPFRLSNAINAGSHNQGVNIQTGPNGEVYTCWAVYDNWPADEKAIGFTRSLNGGTTFQPATRIVTNLKGIRYSGVAKNHRVNSFPVMAVDISGGTYNGNIYIVWTNNGVPGINSGTNRSVYLVRSSDGGVTWSAPVRVNQGPNLAGKEAYFPWISCDAETGVLSVIFYDDRNVSGSQCEVFVAYSTDAGSNWTDFAVSDVAFTPAPIPGLASGYMGDYLGITSKGGKIFPCWTDNRTGSYMTWVSPFELGLNAGFSATNRIPCAATQVTYTDVSSGSPVSWVWNFPGGVPSAYNGKNPPPVTYSTPGTYPVTLTVSDGVNSDSETKAGYIHVKVVTADFTASTVNTEVNKGVVFTDLSSCAPQSWSWSFPGGTPSSYTGQNPPPIFYTTPGTYDVALSVTKNGTTETKTGTGLITVTPTIVRMANGTVTICSGDFCDSGGLDESYLNNEELTMTLLPATAGTKMQVSFTVFNVEAEFDTLAIYDGTNTSAPLIGYYYGTTGPGVITATGANGAITFHFSSDFMVSAPGWRASLNCVSAAVPPIRVIGSAQVTGWSCFDALQTVIVAGTGSLFTVHPGGNATMIAGQNILFKPGTTVQHGGTLRGTIASAGPFCIPPGSNLPAPGSGENTTPGKSSFFRIFPNPNRGDFTLALTGYVPFEPVKVIIYDLQGIQVASAEMINETNHEFSLAGFPAGLYLVMVSSGYQQGSLRMVLGN